MAQRKSNVRDFILQQIYYHPRDIASLTSKTFKISRQAVSRYLQQLIDEGLVVAQGNTRSREYSLVTLAEETFSLPLIPKLEEDKVWRERIRPLLKDVAANVMSICQYGFTEMLNNAIDHSEGENVRIYVRYAAALITLSIVDDGVGIFNKITRDLHLDDERHAILELSKGKLTTDPSRHSGEGIFFTSRVFDYFSIMSGNLYFAHDNTDRDWLLDDANQFNGTIINMVISPVSNRTTQEVFDRYASSEDDYGFTKTHVPVFLARYGDENLVSRSQAKRLLARFDRFKEVLLDFDKVNIIGQAFADEIFRVFQKQNPDINLRILNASQDVEKMIKRAITKED